MWLPALKVLNVPAFVFTHYRELTATGASQRTLEGHTSSVNLLDLLLEHLLITQELLFLRIEPD
jgi:hypothetical protein